MSCVSMDELPYSPATPNVQYLSLGFENCPCTVIPNSSRNRRTIAVPEESMLIFNFSNWLCQLLI